MDTVISVKNLSKKFRRYQSVADGIKEALHPLRKKYHKEFWALEDVSFDVKKGECVGIIGRNGSGKSTLLQILCGIMPPTRGVVNVTGRVSALLELGAGFHPMFTGRENVHLNGALMGFTREQMDERFKAIADFAEIGDFMDQPVRTYSSGMFVRLAFAVAINVDTDILIVDEALAVGDMRFQQKCYRKLQEFKEMGKTILFITHDMAAIKNICGTAAWINEGRIFQIGSPSDVVKSFISYMSYNALATRAAKTAAGQEMQEGEGPYREWEDVSGCSSFGNGGAEIKRVALYSKDPFRKIKTFGGGRVVFSAEILAKEEIASPIIGCVLNNEYGHPVLGIGSWMLGVDIKPLSRNETIIAEIEFNLPLLKNGYYSFTVSIADGTELSHVQHHWVHDAYVFEILNSNSQCGMFYFGLKEGDVDMKIRQVGQEVFINGN